VVVAVGIQRKCALDKRLRVDTHGANNTRRKWHRDFLNEDCQSLAIPFETTGTNANCTRTPV
jgi:Uri superfamily endonuclease